MPLEPLDIVMAVYNEVDVIESVIDEVIRYATPVVAPRILVCEGGSTDGTSELLGALARTRPMMVLSSAERDSYAGAMVRGLRAAETEWVFTMDGDGQCAPADLPRLLAARDGVDAVRGVRSPRRDPTSRLVMSGLFRVLHEVLFHTSLADPSSPVALLRTRALAPWLGRLGELPSGFWWELSAHASRRGLRTREVSVEHRVRPHGATRAFPWPAVPGIAVSHAVGLLRVWRAGP